MGARLRIFLNTEENRTLYELRTAKTVPQRVKDGAEVVRLNHQGMYVEKIAEHFGWNVRTVRETLKQWQNQGLGGLWDAPHPGALHAMANRRSGVFGAMSTARATQL